MAKNECTTVKNSQDSAHNWANKTRMRHLELQARSLLEFIAVDAHVLFSKTTKDVQFVAILIDRYSKLTQAITTSKTSAKLIETILHNNWIVPCRIADYLFTDNGTQIVNKFFKTIITFLEIKHITATKYHPKTIEKAKTYHRMLVARFHQYLAEHQRDWSIFTHLLTHLYNKQVNRQTRTAPFSLVLSKHPPVPTNFHCPLAFPPDTKTATAPFVLWANLLHCIFVMWRKTNTKLTATQRTYINHHNPGLQSTATFRSTQLFYVDHALLCATVSDIMGTDSYLKLFPHKLDSYLNLSSTIEIMTIGEDGLPNKLSSDREMLTTRAETDALTAGASTLHQSKYRESMLGEYSMTDLPNRY